MKKISFVIGSKVNNGEMQERFTATCECGDHVYVATKESSLAYLLTKTAKCCNKNYALTGVQTIAGTENGMEIVPAKTEDDVATIANEPIAEITENKDAVPEATPETGEIDVNNILIPGKRGITNHSMIVAMKDNIGNEKVLITLYEAYPEIYKASIKYLNDKQKQAVYTAVANSLKDFKIILGKRSMDKIPA